MPESIKNNSTSSFEAQYKQSYREVDYSRYSHEEQAKVVKKYFPH